MVRKSKKGKKHDEVVPDFNNPAEFGNWEELSHNRLKNPACYESILKRHVELGFEPTLEGMMKHLDWRLNTLSFGSANKKLFEKRDYSASTEARSLLFR